MHKLVNGVTVEIDNIELFKMAAEGKLLKNSTVNKVQNISDKQMGFIKDVVGVYSDILKVLVYPLNSIENDMRYMCMAMLLKDKLDKEIKVQINNAILVELDEDKVIKLVSDVWGIEQKSEFKPAVNLSLDYFKNMVGYEEYVWAYDRLSNGETTEDYYEIFMPAFYEACRKQDLVVGWEVERILDFGAVPSEMRFITNKLIDIKRDMQYYLDVYCAGNRETNESYLSFDVDEIGKPVMNKKVKKIKVYNYEAFVKGLKQTDNRVEKLGQDSCVGISSLFDVLLEKGIEEDNLHLLDYTGIIEDDTLIFEVGNEIYLTNFNEYKKAIKIMSNVNLFAYEDGVVYGKRSIRLDSGLYEDTIYAYEVTTGKARICNINYRW